jgi:ABC-type transport system substrate-binding protein
MTYRLREFLSAALVAMIALLGSSVQAGVAMAPHGATGPVHGGTVRVAYTGNFLSFDPAQAGFDDWFLLNGTLDNGLYRFDRKGQPELDLAAAPPVVNPDLKTWTFHIRKGVQFSNGMEVTADDVAFSITRVLDPHLKPAPSWGQSTDEIFQGALDFVSGKAKSVSGIQVVDRYTIRFVLTSPAAVLPNVLGESFNFVVPKAVVTRENADYFGSHPIGTGPFILQSWQKGTRAVLVRNPHYFRKGLPYLDRIIAESNVAPSLIALRIQKGELDGFGAEGEIAVPDLQQMRADPRFSSYVVTGPTTFVKWFNMNVHADPMTTLAVRQAVAMAINRDRLVKVLGSTAVPAYQLYVPVDPQYDPTLDQHPIYSYDPQKAAALLKKSGYHGQPVTVFYPSDYPQDVSMAPSIEQDLKQIGLNVTLRGVANTSLFALGEGLKGHPIVFTGWSIDYADAYDLYSAQLSCAGNVAGGGSSAHYCDPTADDLVTQAEALPLGSRRNALLRLAQRRILQSATRVPTVYLKTLQIVSPKIGGYYYHPVFAWQFENYWLNA